MRFIEVLLKLLEMMLLFDNVVIFNKLPESESIYSIFLTLCLGIVNVNIGAKIAERFL